MDRSHESAVFEAVARRVLNEYDPALLWGEPVAVPIEDIALSLGLCIEYQRIRKNGAILGELVYDDGLIAVYDADMKRYDLIQVKGSTIILDESLLRRGSEGRLRFSCAHEVGHWLRHKEIYAGTGQAAAFGNPKKSSEENPIVERQANLLATSLLMPKSQVKKAFYRVRNTANPSERLAKLFGVSSQAMGIFLQEHNLA